MATAETARREIQRREGDAAATLDDYLGSRKTQQHLAAAVPREVDVNRWLRVALTVVRKNPQLLRCTVPSILGGMIEAAQLGVELGPLGECYLVPYKNGKTGQFEAQFQLGYKGIIKLARRGGSISRPMAIPVFDDDQFSYELGMEPRCYHRPIIDPTEANKDRLVAAYFRWNEADGPMFQVATRAVIEERRQRNPAVRQKRSSPWDTDYIAMARKTPVRVAQPFLTMSAELQRAFEVDDSVIKLDPTAAPDERLVELPPSLDVLADPDQLDDQDQDQGEGERENGAKEAEGATGEPSRTAQDATRYHRLSKDEYGKLHKQGVDNTVRPQLIHLITDGKNRSSAKLTADDKRQLLLLGEAMAMNRYVLAGSQSNPQLETPNGEATTVEQILADMPATPTPADAPPPPEAP
jgi:recombination protein RecT